MKKRKVFLALLILILAAVGIWYYNISHVVINEYEVKSEKIHDDVTIVQMTDLHGSEFGRENSVIIKKIDSVCPDFVCITGDMYSHGDDKGRERAYKLLTKLAEKYDVYYVNGEHDNSDSFKEELKESGVNVLDYDTAEIKKGDTRIKLYGINNVYYSPTFDLANEFELDENSYNILLAHITNYDAFKSFGLDMALCGDTHGGQVRFPFVNVPQGNGNTLPDSNTDNSKGMFCDGDFTLIISSGLGNYPVPVRLFNLPEVAVVRLSGNGD